MKKIYLFIIIVLVILLVGLILITIKGDKNFTPTAFAIESSEIESNLQTNSSPDFLENINEELKCKVQTNVLCGKDPYCSYCDGTWMSLCERCCYESSDDLNDISLCEEQCSECVL